MTVRQKYWVSIPIVLLLVFLQIGGMLAIVTAGFSTAESTPWMIKTCLGIGGISFYFWTERWLSGANRRLRDWTAE